MRLAIWAARSDLMGANAARIPPTDGTEDNSPGKDLSIIGFDDVQDAALATPALSTISTHPYELGTLLAKTILDRIADPLQPVKTSLIETQLILRETTAPAT